jgi:hypothetical protein
MDLIQRAQAKRDQLRHELARIEAFLATAFELEQDLSREKPADRRSDAEKADAPMRRTTTPRSGIGKDTLDAAAATVRQFGEMSTREMLPYILAKGIEIGGKDPIATLSARLSGKGVLEVYHGKWRFIEHTKASGPHDGSEEETADTPTKDASAASLFNTSQGATYAAALAS